MPQGLHRLPQYVVDLAGKKLNRGPEIGCRGDLAMNRLDLRREIAKPTFQRPGVRPLVEADELRQVVKPLVDAADDARRLGRCLVDPP